MRTSENFKEEVFARGRLRREAEKKRLRGLLLCAPMLVCLCVGIAALMPYAAKQATDAAPGEIRYSGGDEESAGDLYAQVETDGISGGSPGMGTAHDPVESISDPGDFSPEVEGITADYTALLAAARRANPRAETVRVLAYYGKYAGGAEVAMLDMGCAYTQAFWSETVAGRRFVYTNGNRLQVLFDGALYTLPDAYAKGYMSAAEIGALHARYAAAHAWLYPEVRA